MKPPRSLIVFNICKLLLFLSFFTFLSFTSKSQPVVFQWTHSFGNPANDYGFAITTDKAGNTYTTGQFSNTVDFDPGPGVFNLTSTGSYNTFILKLDPAGNFVWAKTLDGTGVAGANEIKIAADGSIYFCGAFGGVLDFDPGPGFYNLSTGVGSEAAFIVKLDANANFLWAKQFESIDIKSIDTDTNGNVFATGGFYGTADFDPGTGVFNLTEKSFTGIVTGVEDAFVFKLTAAGNFAFAFQIGSTRNEYANKVCVDQTGNFVLTGFFCLTADFDPSLNTYNIISDGADIFIAKYTNTGNLNWVKNFSGGNGNDLSYDIKVDASNNVYVAGSFGGNMDFDPGPGGFNLVANNGGVFIVKLDGNGSFIWAKNTTGNRSQRGIGIALDTFDNPYVTGDFDGTSDFDPGPSVYNLTANGYRDIFILKLNTDGTFAWAVSMGSNINDDEGIDIVVDQSRNVYTTGHFWGTVDFDPGPGAYDLTMVGTGDAFIQKLSQCVNLTYDTINVNFCSGYTLNNQTYLASGTYTQVLQNSLAVTV